MKFTILRKTVFIFCIIGIIVSLYAYYVEISKEKDKNYRALCDLSSYISCSRVFTSKYGRGFGIVAQYAGHDSPLNQPNSVFGVLFYCFQIMLTLMKSRNCSLVALILSVVSNFGSVYLGYILFFILKDFCIVCTSMYVINFVLLVVNSLIYRRSGGQVKKEHVH